MIKKTKMEYGDFQTPQDLADAVTAFPRRGYSAFRYRRTNLRPWKFCARGTRCFPKTRQIFAFDINDAYISAFVKKSVIQTAHWHDPTGFLHL